MTHEPMFYLGKIAATPCAAKALKQSNQAPGELIARHISGDWGEVPPEDAVQNEEAVKNGGRIVSAYKLRSGEIVWVITEGIGPNGRRESTSILLPEEY